ncbi:MAG: leucine-rich repeat protein [Oscillospiraceae bacterium]|nr:leucine-rich repeat protein [Oscillospiraceae bacterium]
MSWGGSERHTTAGNFERCYSIGKQAFLECGIKTITIPGSVTDIGTQAFAYCSQLTEISVSTDNPVYCSVDGVLFDKDKTELLCYPAGKETFSCSYEVPDGVTKIGDCSFQACRILEEVILPDGVTSIGAAAFNYCSITRMTLPDGVISIGNGAFEACGELTSITIPDSVTFIDDIAFSACDSLTDVYYGGSEMEWNAIYIGSDNDCLIYNATIHYNSTGSGSTGDTGDTGDTDDADDTDTMSGTCGENATWTLKNGVLTISGTGDMEDYDVTPWSTLWESITDVVVEDGITSIGDVAFVGCINLTSVAIPDSVISIGENAFSSCMSLANVTIPDSVTSIGVAAFMFCNNLTDMIIPDSVTSIGDWAFCACSSMESVTISANVTSIGEAAFQNCSSLASVTIPDSVTSIGYAAFAWCSNLTNVTIPDSVTSIDEAAFSGCSSLTDVYYSGSETEWNAIEIGSYNDYLTSATIHYNSTGPEDETGDSTPGDLNGDDEVDASDLTILARHVGKVEYITDETALANADVTGDGNVDASDLTKLAQYVGKIISSLD